MPSPRKQIESELKEDLKQNWVANSYRRVHTDQFGFEISYGTKITLNYRNQWQIPVQTISAAKLISKVWLNDVILNKPIDEL